MWDDHMKYSVLRSRNHGRSGDSTTFTGWGRALQHATEGIRPGDKATIICRTAGSGEPTYQYEIRCVDPLETQAPEQGFHAGGISAVTDNGETNAQAVGGQEPLEQTQRRLIGQLTADLAREGRNVAYYQGLLDRIGHAFGERAFVADDGSVQYSVLRAKLPEVAVGVMREMAQARGHAIDVERRVMALERDNAEHVNQRQALNGALNRAQDDALNIAAVRDHILGQLAERERVIAGLQGEIEKHGAELADARREAKAQVGRQKELIENLSAQLRRSQEHRARADYDTARAVEANRMLNGKLARLEIELEEAKAQVARPSVEEKLKQDISYYRGLVRRLEEVLMGAATRPA